MSRASVTELFVFLHVLGAIAAVGPSITYGIWVARTERHRPEATLWVLQTIRWIDRHLVTPAYLWQAVTGFVLIEIAPWPFWGSHWLVAGVGLYVLAMVLAIAFVGPLARRRLALVERGGAEGAEDVGAEYARVSARLRAMLAVVVLVTLAIVYLMVVKPSW